MMLITYIYENDNSLSIMSNNYILNFGFPSNPKCDHILNFDIPSPLQVEKQFRIQFGNSLLPSLQRPVKDYFIFN
jgi:hypothetical protein